MKNKNRGAFNVKKMMLKRSNNGDTENSGFRTFIFLILSLCIVGIAFYAYMSTRNIDISRISPNELWGLLKEGILEGNGTEVVSEINFDPGSNVGFNVYRDYILEVSKFGIRFVDKNAKEQYTYSFKMNKPKVESSGPFVAVADIGGKDVYVFNGSQKVWNKSLEATIVSFDIGKNGHLSVVHEEKRYQAAVVMFDPKGEVVFNLGKVENFIINSKISPSGEQILLNELNVSNIKVKSTIEFADISGRLDEKQINLENIVIVKAGYMNDGSVAVIGDSEIKTFDKTMKEKWSQKFNGKMFGANICDERYIITAGALEDENGMFNNSKSTIKIFEKDELKATANIDDQIGNIVSFTSTIVVHSNKNVYFMNTKGKILGKFECMQDVNDVMLFDDSTALVVGKTRAYVIKIL